MRVPPWARWALAAVLVLGIAAVGVAANLAVLGSTSDDTRLGTLNAGSLASAPQAQTAPTAGTAPQADDEGDGDHGGGGERDDERGGDDRDDD